MSSPLIQALDDLDMQMLDAFNAYASEILTTWESFSGNEGQMTIVHQHVLEVVQEHIQQAKQQWPYGATPDDYADAVRSCYDSAVMDRAFSDTIESSYSNMYDYWAQAMEWQQTHDSLMATINAMAPPHSTARKWQ